MQALGRTPGLISRPCLRVVQLRAPARCLALLAVGRHQGSLLAAASEASSKLSARNQQLSASEPFRRRGGGSPADSLPHKEISNGGMGFLVLLQSLLGALLLFDDDGV
jgi:hypothetical protein